MTKVACITGAGKRIGAEIARVLHSRGCNIVLHVNRSVDEGNSVVDELNALRAGSATLVQADLTDRAETAFLAESVLAEYGRLDILVNNASMFYPTEIGTVNQQSWDELIDSNLRAAFFLTQSLSDELTMRSGTVVNLVDTHADRPLAGFPTYSIAKAGVKAMTRSLAIELAPEVRVNGVSPGAILWPPSLEDDDDPEVIEKRAIVLKKIPLQKLGQEKDIAEAVAYLALEALYITGQVLKVDGGRSLS